MLEMPGIEPGAFHMQSERATTALHPPPHSAVQALPLFILSDNSSEVESHARVASEGKQSGAVEACWAHNPEVDRSKLSSANFILPLADVTSSRSIAPSTPLAQAPHIAGGWHNVTLVCVGPL